MDDELKLTIDEWLEQEMRILSEFVSDWRKRNVSEPENWPLKMPAGEWDEQFITYHHGGDNDVP